MITDHMEQIIADALTRAGIKFHHDGAPDRPPQRTNNLDFYLPDFDLYIEVKRLHSDRIAKQMAKGENVIAIQGLAAAHAFASMLKYPKLRGLNNRMDWGEVFALHPGATSHEIAKAYDANPSTVRQAAARRGVVLGESRVHRGIDWDTEIDAALRDGETKAQVAKRLRVNPRTVSNALSARNIVLAMTAVSQQRLCNRKRKIDWEAELTAAAAAGETRAMIAKRLNVTYPAVVLAVNRYKIEIPKSKRGRKKS